MKKSSFVAASSGCSFSDSDATWIEPGSAVDLHLGEFALGGVEVGSCENLQQYLAIFGDCHLLASEAELQLALGVGAPIDLFGWRHLVEKVGAAFLLRRSLCFGCVPEMAISLPDCCLCLSSSFLRRGRASHEHVRPMIAIQQRVPSLFRVGRRRDRAARCGRL